jgi:hypothetical protein
MNINVTGINPGGASAPSRLIRRRTIPAQRLAAAGSHSFPEDEQAELARRLQAVERAVAVCTRMESRGSPGAKTVEKW